MGRVPDLASNMKMSGTFAMPSAPGGIFESIRQVYLVKRSVLFLNDLSVLMASCFHVSALHCAQCTEDLVPFFRPRCSKTHI